MWKTAEKSTESASQSPSSCLKAFLMPAVVTPKEMSLIADIPRASPAARPKPRRKYPKSPKASKECAPAQDAPTEATPKEHEKVSQTPYIDSEAKPTLDILNKPSDYWYEENLYDYFTKANPLVLPELVYVEEMLLRRRGGMKVKVVFKNNAGDLCPVWIPGCALYEHYRDAYQSAKALFSQRI